MAQAANKSGAAAPANELVLAEDSFLPTYSWSQTLADVSICVPLPANISAKMLDIVFQRQSIKVAIKGGRTILTGTLSATVYPDDCFWTLDKGCVEITLSKTNQKQQWRCVIEGDSDPLSPEEAAVINENIYFSDLDPESRKNVSMVVRGHKGSAEASNFSPVGLSAIGVPWRAVVADSPPTLSCEPQLLPSSEPQIGPEARVSASDAAAVGDSGPACAAAPASQELELGVAFDAFGLEPEVKALAASLYGLKCGLKKHCAEYAAGLELQGVLNVDHLRRLPETDAWAIVKRAGFKVVPQQTLMRKLFGRSVVDPDRDAEDKFALVVPPEQIVEKKNYLKIRMEEQKLRIDNDRSEPLTDQQRATLHPEVQKLYGVTKLVASRNGHRHLPLHLQQLLGELWVEYVERLSQWETKVRTLPPEEAERFVKRLIVERAVLDKRMEVSHKRHEEDELFLANIEKRRANPQPYETCELHPVTMKTVNFQYHSISYFCTDCWRGICPTCFGSCCRNHKVQTIEIILRGVEDSITKGQEQRKLLIREEEEKKKALSAMRERKTEEGDKEGAKQVLAAIKRCNERIASSDEYVETLRAQFKFLEGHFHLPCVGRANSIACTRVKEWFQSHGVGADWVGPNLSLPVHAIVDPAPDDETEALTKQALALSDNPADDDMPPMLIPIGP